MAETDRWLTEYGRNHQDLSFPAVYWVAVLTLVVATVGMLWSLPVPDRFAEISPILNWGSTFLMAAVVYYFIISMPLAIGMLSFVFGVGAIQVWLVNSAHDQVLVSASLFLASLAGLFLGHHAGGGVRAVLRDIQLMMIGPAWLLSNLYRRLGIPI